MKRLLISIPVALLLAILIISPCYAVSANDIASEFAISDVGILADGGPIFTSYPYADNATLPQGMKLTAEIPFINPTEVNKGDPVTIKAQAVNQGAAQIDYTLELIINDKSAGTQQVKLAPAESKIITFLYVTKDAGTNSVKLPTITPQSFTVKGGSFFDLLPTYVWIFLGVVLAVVVMLIILLVLRPKKKNTAGQPDFMMQKGQQKGKAGRPGEFTGGPQMPMQGQMPQPGMQGMAGMQEGGSGMGMPGPFPAHSQFDMPAPGGQGMQPPFARQPQPGMPPMPQGIPHPQVQQQQFQNPPHMSQGGMQPPSQPGGMHAMPAGGGPAHPGISHQMTPSPLGQPGAPYGMQVPSQYPQPPHISQAPMPAGMPHPVQPGMQPPMQAPVGPGMQPPMQAPMGPGMQPPMQAPMGPGMQPQAPGGFQSTGMPKFSVSNLTVTPNRVKVGEPVNISLSVSNNGIQSGKYSVVLRIGGVVENIIDLTLPPGASQTASFTAVKDVAGDYYTDIDGLGGFFTVIPLAPPAFTTSNFSVTPERVRQGQPVAISASVTNVGELAGSHTLILRIKGVAESQKEINLPPGKSQDVEFQVIKDTPGFYPISLENWTGKFVVEMDWTG
jgi:hypothetical protein